VLNFKCEFEADLDVEALSTTKGVSSCQQSIFNSKKFFLEIQMCFKEATQAEIESSEKVELRMTREQT